MRLPHVVILRQPNGHGSGAARTADQDPIGTRPTKRPRPRRRLQPLSSACFRVPDTLELDFPSSALRPAISDSHSLHPEDTSDKPDLALLKTAPRVPGFLREIVDVHPQRQRTRCGVCGRPAQMSVAGILEEFSDESTLAENRASLFGRDKETVVRVGGQRK